MYHGVGQIKLIYFNKGYRPQTRGFTEFHGEEEVHAEALRRGGRGDAQVSTA